MVVGLESVLVHKANKVVSQRSAQALTRLSNAEPGGRGATSGGVLQRGRGSTA